MQPRNLAARAGRWSATHRKTAIIGWILFVVLATVIGGKVGQKNLEPSAMGNGESKRGDMIVDAAGFPDTSASASSSRARARSSPVILRSPRPPRTSSIASARSTA